MTNEKCAEKTLYTVYSYWDGLAHWFSNDYMAFALTKRQACVGPGQNKGTCLGDSGSPSVVRIESLYYYMQTGIHSKGFGGVCNLNECNCKMGVAAKVQTEIGWIESHITGKRCHKPKINCNDCALFDDGH